jgi:predicted phage terminase large subunit-like protein
MPRLPRRSAASAVAAPHAGRLELVLRRLLAIEQAHDDLVRFAELVNPTPDQPDDPDKSLYQPERFHRVMAAGLQALERGFMHDGDEPGTCTRLIISLPPRHGKTQLASKSFIPWYVGRHPHGSTIFGTYNDKFSQDIGRAVRDIMQHPAYRQVFPDAVLKEESQAADRLETTSGGVLAFVGRGGTTTGRGGDLLVVDDPVKDRAEADSPTIRESMWNWFNQIIGTRMMTDRARILLVQTRWHEDDIVGRLTDPSNDFYDEHVAKRWKIIDLPALAMSDDVLGRKEGEALWPKRFGVSFLKDQRRQDPRGFSALYQGRPSPEQGNFFRSEWLGVYRPNQLPQNLRIYAASDHAVSLVQGRDKTALVLVGVDEQDDIWVLPQSILRQLDSNMAVDTMLGLIREHKPLFWWAERGQVSKSIGPFLRKRMLEESAFCSIIELTPVMDKQTRAQSIQGRMAMRKLHFPEFANWWPEARDQILKFPHAQHDDFVDALAYIGLGLQQQVPMAPIRRREVHGPHTFGALLAQRRNAERHVRLRHTGGW